jgi:hypothetical protein
MDSLTARYLARELDERWRGRRVTGSRFDREARTLVLAVDGRAVRLDLSTPDVVAREEPDAPADGLLRGWMVAGVRSPLDDRRLMVELTRPGRFKGSAERHAVLEVSVLPAARGAVLRDAGGAHLASIGARIPPLAAPRPALEADRVDAAARAGDVDALLGGRWMSPAVARWLVSDPDRAAERYQMLLGDTQAEPARIDGRPFPFPMSPDAEPVPSLIIPASEAAEPARAVETPRGRVERARRRMEAELERAREAPRVREVADALVLLGAAPAPAVIELADGSAVATGARPAESALDVAERLYGDVRSMERALQVLPERLAALVSSGDEGQRMPGNAPRARRELESEARAFRTYRSSGGLDIWVGRGAASNDALTFRAAAPEDVWLHARDAAGAHVVLRWRRPEPPPARDLEEAALLAAWHSRSRGSAVVPVDWTRRKYVRKPRGGAPGLVVVQRCETVMVRPDAEAERRLRER